MENDNLVFLREMNVCVCSGWAQVAFLLTELFFVSVQEFEADVSRSDPEGECLLSYSHLHHSLFQWITIVTRE